MFDFCKLFFFFRRKQNVVVIFLFFFWWEARSLQVFEFEVVLLLEVELIIAHLLE